jgi:hypothetical protein
LAHCDADIHIPTERDIPVAYDMSYLFPLADDHITETGINWQIHADDEHADDNDDILDASFDEEREEPEPEVVAGLGAHAEDDTEGSDAFGESEQLQEDSIAEEERFVLNMLMQLGMATPDTQILQPEVQAHGSERDIRHEFGKIVYSEYYEGAAQVIGTGPTLLEKFARDQYADVRKASENVYYPMASFMEWEFTNVLLRLPVSLNWKNELLNTQLVSGLTTHSTTYANAYSASS